MGIIDYSSEERIQKDREQFRAEATDALKCFPLEDRETAASMETNHVKTSDVLKVWSQQIAPIFADLDAKQNEARFRQTIIRNIGFSEHDAEQAIAAMVTRRKDSLLREVLDNLYHVDLHDVTYQRDFAEEFLNRSESDIQDFMFRYGEFILAVDMSEKHNITLIDVHSRWLERQRSALAVHKERQQIVQDEDTRLQEIEIILDRLTKSTDSLLGRIVAKNWNFSTILELRDKYQKQIDDLSKTDKKSPSKKLKLFEKVTASFRDRETERLADRETASNLKELRALNEDIYSLLLEVFDLNTGERTRLLTDIEKYTRLSKERDMLLLIQRNREQFLSVHG